MDGQPTQDGIGIPHSASRRGVDGVLSSWGGLTGSRNGARSERRLGHRGARRRLGGRGGNRLLGEDQSHRDGVVCRPCCGASLGRCKPGAGRESGGGRPPFPCEVPRGAERTPPPRRRRGDGISFTVHPLGPWCPSDQPRTVQIPDFGIK